MAKKNSKECRNKNHSQYFDFSSSTSFVDIDFKQENKDVELYQKTKDPELLEKLYIQRIPTLQIWAQQYGYLVDSNEDMFGELVPQFLRAISKYERGKGSFNTYLFKSLQNCIRNKYSRGRAKKRVPYGMEAMSSCLFLLSMDYDYNQKEGDHSTLKDVLSSKILTGDKITNDIGLRESIQIICQQDEHMKDVLKRISDGDTLASIIQDAKTQKGKIKISKAQANIIKKKKRNKTVVSNLIKKNTDIKTKFGLVQYNVLGENDLHYTICLHKTKNADRILKSMRKFRRNKSIREHLKG